MSKRKPYKEFMSELGDMPFKEKLEKWKEYKATFASTTTSTSASTKKSKEKANKSFLTNEDLVKLGVNKVAASTRHEIKHGKHTYIRTVSGWVKK